MSEHVLDSPYANDEEVKRIRLHLSGSNPAKDKDSAMFSHSQQAGLRRSWTRDEQRLAGALGKGKVYVPTSSSPAGTCLPMHKLCLADKLRIVIVRHHFFEPFMKPWIVYQVNCKAGHSRYIAEAGRSIVGDICRRTSRKISTRY